MTKRRDKQLKNVKRAYRAVEAAHNARLAYLMSQEMEFERRYRNKALRMARKRKTSYIQ